jgi:RNA polymerase sigma-70 factor (ECF subfamily)
MVIGLAPSARGQAGAGSALAETAEPDTALRAVDELDLGTYHLYHATRAALLRRLGRTDEAAAAYDAVLKLTNNPAEQAFLAAKAAQLRNPQPAPSAPHRPV